MTNNTLKEVTALIPDDFTTREAIDEAVLVVTRQGSLIKNKHGKTARDNRLQCNLVKMTITEDQANLHFPEGECCDMQGAINLATSARPSVTLIQTWSGDEKDTNYLRTGDHWNSFLVAKRWDGSKMGDKPE